MNPLSYPSLVCFAAALSMMHARCSLAADEPSERPALKVMFFGGELPEVRKELEKRYRLTAVTGGLVADTKKVDGLEKLAGCDVWIGSIQKRIEPSDEQLAYFKKFHQSGGAVLGYRAATHVFQNYLAADKEIFGAKYGNHHLSEKDPQLVIEVTSAGKDHALLKGLTPPPPRSGSYYYTELTDDVKVLLRSGLAGDMMPHTWTRENAKTKGRVFYTRYDAKDLAENETCRELFLRGLAWVAKREPGR
jgi:hypothetical protein